MTTVARLVMPLSAMYRPYALATAPLGWKSASSG